jgi:hypothetical protein
MYAFGPQGRPGGIKALTLAQALKAPEHGQMLSIDDNIENCPMSTKFKTQESYIFQPVPIPAITRPLLTAYLTLFRPKIAKSHHMAADDPEAPMFLNFLTGTGKAIQLQYLFFYDSG